MSCPVSLCCNGSGTGAGNLTVFEGISFWLGLCTVLIGFDSIGLIRMGADFLQPARHRAGVGKGQPVFIHETYVEV